MAISAGSIPLNSEAPRSPAVLRISSKAAIWLKAIISGGSAVSAQKFAVLPSFQPPSSSFILPSVNAPAM